MIGSVFFTLGQYLIQLWEIKGKIFAESSISNFFKFISQKTINRSEINLSLVCFPFNSEQNCVQLLYFDRMFVTEILRHYLDKNSVALNGKIPEENRVKIPY